MTSPRIDPPSGQPAGADSRLPLAVTLALMGVILFIRKSPVFLLPQFFAEDACFYSDALVHGPAALFRPFVGYYHLAPRLIAEFAAHFDPRLAPAIFIAGSVAGLLAVGAACFSPRINLPGRPLLALALVLVPHTGEVFANLATLNFILAPGLLLLVLADDPRTRLQWLADVGALVLAGLSGPFIVFWFPLFLWRFIRRRSPASGGLAGLAVGLALIHVAALLADPAKQHPGMSPWSLWWRVPWQRMVGALFLPRAWAEHAPLLLLNLLGLALLGLLVWFARTAVTARSERWTLLVAAVLVTAPVLYKFRGELGLLASNQNGDRYFYLPKVILLWLLAGEAGRAAWRPRLAAALFAVGVLASLLAFRWRESYEDFQWSHYAEIVRRGDAVVVPVNPSGWTMPLPDRAHRAR